MAVNPKEFDRAKLWGDLVARKLLAALMAGQIDKIGMPEIEQACDAANRAMTRRVDRGLLLDQTSKRLVELAVGPPLDRLALAESPRGVMCVPTR